MYLDIFGQTHFGYVPQSVLANWAIRHPGLTATEVGKYLGLSKFAVSRAATKGQKLIVDQSLFLKDYKRLISTPLYSQWRYPRYFFAWPMISPSDRIQYCRWVSSCAIRPILRIRLSPGLRKIFFRWWMSETEPLQALETYWWGRSYRKCLALNIEYEGYRQPCIKIKQISCTFLKKIKQLQFHFPLCYFNQIERFSSLLQIQGRCRFAIVAYAERHLTQ